MMSFIIELCAVIVVFCFVPLAFLWAWVHRHE